MIPDAAFLSALALSTGAAAYLVSRRVRVPDGSMPAGRPERLLLIGSAALLAAGSLVSIPAGLLLAAVPLSVRGAARALARSSRRKKLTGQLPAFLDRLGSTLRSGVGLERALAQSAEDGPEPLRSELALTVRELQMGKSLVEAIEDFASRLSVEDAKLAATAIGISQETGGNLSEILSRVSSTVRDRQTVAAKLAALTAQGKMQAVVVGFLPVGLGAFLWISDPESIRSFVLSGAGQKLLALAAVLEIAGVAWILRIARLDA